MNALSMAGIHVADKRDFFPENPEMQLSAAAARMREFLGHIVRAATASRLEAFLSGVPCRRRPSNRRCPGSIGVRKNDLPEPLVFWECAECGDGGRISGFRGCSDDLRTLGTRPPEATERGRKVLLTAEEYRAWLSGDMIEYDVEAMRTIYSAVKHRNGVAICASEGELEDLCAATAADANHEPSRKRRDLLASVCDKLSGTPVRPRLARRAPKHGLTNGFGESIVQANSARAHGFFSALIAGPMVMPSRWLPRFVQPEHESMGTFESSLRHVMAVYNDMADGLLQTPERFEAETLAIARRDARGDALIEWHRGFFEAMELSPEAWGNLLSLVAVKDLLQPLAIISQCEADPSKRDWLADKTLREDLGRSLGVMTVRLWDVCREEAFNGNASAHTPERRQARKVSRNEPCPCGSGKKYKRCCGSSLRAV